MMTILIWLGSGFAFAAGVFVGAWAFCKFRNSDSKQSSEIIDNQLRNIRCLEKRNQLLETQTRVLSTGVVCLTETMQSLKKLARKGGSNE